MIAARSPMCSVNMILLSDGREIHLDDVATSAEGQAILDDVDAAIDRIEAQLDAPPFPGSGDPDWRRRAQVALKKKRRSRPRIQLRIADLRRAERQVPQQPAGAGQARRDVRRKAFIDAAEQLLEHDLFTEIWARAQEMRPEAFQDGEAQA
jgi:hypothetical protein